ncbi:MAG: 2-C-methyl-D-erythritol 4-phosphate cytidylyltransferase [Cellulosilyticaceae bacterium]
MKIDAIIVAGGSGKRMGTAVKKQYIKLKDKEVLAHTVEIFENHPDINAIIVVVGKDDCEYVEELLKNQYGYKKIQAVVAGGAERQDSVYNGIEYISKCATHVLVHDGARPFLNKQTIDQIKEKMQTVDACVVGVPVKDTIKCVTNQKTIESTPEREKLWSIQTPQTFKRELIIEAYRNAKHNKVCGTDDSMLVESIGETVHVICGDYNNIKITTIEDLVFAEAIMKLQI